MHSLQNNFNIKIFILIVFVILVSISSFHKILYTRNHPYSTKTNIPKSINTISGSILTNNDNRVYKDESTYDVFQRIYSSRKSDLANILAWPSLGCSTEQHNGIFDIDGLHFLCHPAYNLQTNNITFAEAEDQYHR